MKANKLAILGLMSLSVALLPSCGSDGWKSDAKSIYVRAGDNSATYRSNQVKTKERPDEYYYYTTELRYLEDGDSITIKKIRIAWTATTYAISSNETRTTFTQGGSSEAVRKYAHASWIIEY